MLKLVNESKKMNTIYGYLRGVTSVGNGMILYLYIAKVDLEGNSRLGSLCTYDMYNVGLLDINYVGLNCYA